MTVSTTSALPSVTRWRGASLVRGAAIACTLVAALLLSAQFVLSAVPAVGLALPITHPEGATIAAMLRVRDGEALYQNFLEYPHLITPYPPVQAVAAGLVSRLLGLSLLEMIGLTRSMTLASAIAATLLIGLTARQLGAGALAAVAGGSLFLPLPFLDEWGFSARPDVPAVALSLLALLLLVMRPRQVWLAALVAVLAIFTKQTAVALPVAATLWLLCQRRWGAAATFVGTWVSVTAAVVGVLELATGGTYVLNTVLAHLNTPKNGFDLAFRDFSPFFRDDWLPILLAALCAVLPALRARALLPLLYLGTSAGLALYSLRNTGGDVNYLIEPAAAVCISAALAIDWIWRAASAGAQRVRNGSAGSIAGANPGPTVPTVAGTVFAVALAIGTLVWTAGLWDFWRLDGGVEQSGRMPIPEILAAETVLSEEPLAVLLAGHPLVVSDTFHLSMLTTSGFFDPLELERRIKRSEFDLIVMRSDVRAARWWKRQLLLPDGVRLAIKDTYVPAGRVGIYWLYKPEKRPGAGR